MIVCKSNTCLHAIPVFYIPKPKDNDIRGDKWKIENKMKDLDGLNLNWPTPAFGDVHAMSPQLLKNDLLA